MKNALYKHVLHIQIHTNMNCNTVCQAGLKTEIYVGTLGETFNQAKSSPYRPERIYIYIYTHTHTHIYMFHYIYIYIYEKKDISGKNPVPTDQKEYIYIHTYIYIS